MAIKMVKAGDNVLAKLLPSEEWRSGLGFYSEDIDYIQVGTWSYNSDKELLAHIHNEVERKISRTQEVLYVRQGKIAARIYDLEENFVEELIVRAGDTLILLNSGHGYKVLEDNTQVLEVKNGPYLGAEIDRRRI
jgi:hypothetical protein